MTTVPMSSAPRLRAVAGVFAAWLGISLLFAAISLSIEAPSSTGRVILIVVNVFVAIVWTALSFLIAAWHARARHSGRRAWQLLVAHLPVLLLASVIDAAIVRAIAQLVSGGPLRIPFLATLVYYADFDIVRYLAIVAVTEAVLLRRAVLERQQVAARITGLLSRARLDHLEAQLKPHFLFNALGAVSELAFRMPATAAHVVRQLAAVIRQSSGQRSDEVTLGAELLAIEPYLEVQRLRFADWLTIEYDVAERAADCLLPRFVLQPLVENAIRHGLSGRRAPGTIRLSARVEAEMLIVQVADNGVGLKTGSTSTGHRIGLENVRERLSILYRDDERLRLFDGPGGGAIAELAIPARHRASNTDPGSVSSTVGHDASAAELESVTTSPPQWSAAVRHHPVLVSLGTWLACGVLWSQQSFLYAAVRGRLVQSNWVSIVAFDLTNAMLWAAITPLVIGVARAFPLERARLGTRSLAYAAGAALIAFMHALLLERLTNPSTPVWSPAYEMTLAVDLVIVVILVTIAHRGRLLEWLAAREEAAVGLRAQLELARHRAARLQAIAPVLLSKLERLSSGLEEHPASAEALISDLADYVRLALESSHAGDTSPKDGPSLDLALSPALTSAAAPYALSPVARC